ncbi:MAG: putative sporulation protein YtxC [Alicyclobacillus sp.]|nr:putative sporulation protein YtxC [Alicyclobacillus sp.]
MRIVSVESEFAASGMARRLAEAGYCVSRERADARQLAISLAGDAGPLADVLAECVWNDWLYAYIDHDVRVRFPYLDSDEREYVALLTQHALRSQEAAESEEGLWIRRIRAELLPLLDGEPGFCNLDGVMRFRAKVLLQTAEDAAGEVVEQFLADREYEEFVSLLRYMLESRPLTQSVIHLFCTDERVWMCDEAGALIRDDAVTEAAHQVAEDGDVNVEDLAMSVLITRSPCRIVLHDVTHAAPWPSFPETVERVFLNRAVRCRNCAACRRLEQGDAGEAPRDLSEGSGRWLPRLSD